MADDQAPPRELAQLANEWKHVIQARADVHAGHELLVYRTLVRRGILAAVRAELPRTSSCLGSLFETLVEAWIDEALPASPYVRDMAAEFVAWGVAKRPLHDRVPDWLWDVARYDALVFEVAAAVGGGTAAGPLELDRAVCFDAAVRIARFDWAVHRMDESIDISDKPEAETTDVLVVRDADHEVHPLTLSPLAAAILARLLQGRTLGDAVVDACRSLGHDVDDSVLRSTAECLADLADRGVVLGAVEARGR